jgi:hypothetical protein
MRGEAKRLTLAMAVLAIVVGVAGAAHAEPGSGPAYTGADLEISGLSLGNDRPFSISDVPVRQPGASEGLSGGADRKNPMVAFLLSCAVPGWGEIYAGETERGRWFMTAEAAIWGGYGAFRIQENMRRDDYTEFASIFAGVPDGASEQYLSDIGDYIRWEGDRSYNQAVRSEARSLYPDDLEAQAAYFDAHSYSSDQAWDWGSTERFLQYVELRHAASRSDRNAFFMTGIALLNRALSAVDGAWMARRHNAGSTEEPPARLSIAPEVDNGVVGARATLVVPF